MPGQLNGVLESMRPVLLSLMGLAALAFIWLAFLPSALGNGEARRARLLLVGDIFPCPVIVLCESDPLYDYTPIQTREIPSTEAQRYIRLYFPRTRDELYGFASLFFVDADMDPFTGQQVAAMLDSVAKGHSGTFWTFGPHYSSVVACMLEAVVPHEMSHEFKQWSWGNDFYTVTFRRNLPPVFTSFIDLGLEKVRAYGCGQTVPRPGSTIWGDLVPFGWPWMTSWRYGGNGGVCWVAADDLDHPWWSGETYGFCENKYAIDVLANIITYTVGQELPDDVLVPIRIRREFLDYRSRKSLFVSILEFVEKFGADAGSLYDEFSRVDLDIVGQAKASYVEGDYDQALAGIRQGNEEVKALCDKALEARERALLWIFLVEWLAVSGTSMFAGFIVWTLMVRRRLYREVATTRLLTR